MFVPPIFTKLCNQSKNILLAGMGGGYDVFAGLPLYFELSDLKKKGHPFGNIVLANLSFTEKLTATDLGLKVTPYCIESRYSDYKKANREKEYDASLGYPRNYYAEWHLSKWFYERHSEDIPVYAFSLFDMGVPQLTEAFDKICKMYSIDTIILCDAGVDSILKGDEQGMGTFAEDLLSILAVKNMNVPYKYLMCVGLGTEGDISEYDFLENWAAIQANGGFLGSVCWQKEMKSVQEYLDAMAHSVPTNSSINAQIVESIPGRYGKYMPDYLVSRLNHPLILNPLMAMSWYFDLNTVIEYRKYLDAFNKASSVTNTHSIMEVQRMLDKVTNFNGQYIAKRTYKTWF